MNNTNMLDAAITKITNCEPSPVQGLKISLHKLLTMLSQITALTSDTPSQNGFQMMGYQPATQGFGQGYQPYGFDPTAYSDFLGDIKIKLVQVKEVLHSNLRSALGGNEVAISTIRHAITAVDSLARKHLVNNGVFHHGSSMDWSYVMSINDNALCELFGISLEESTPSNTAR